MKTRMRVAGVSTFDAVRQVVQAETATAGLSTEESALLAGQLTELVARVERVRALGPAFAGIDASGDVRDILARLEVGSSLETGVH
jgi:hypothetical protein